MTAYFERFTLCMTKNDARACSHQEQCDGDVEDYLRHCKAINRQLGKIGPDGIRAELEEYGAWDTEELADDNANRKRIVWIAAGNIMEEQK